MEQMQTPMADFLKTSLAKIKEMVDANTVVGDPVTTPDGVTLVPVSRVSLGFAGGGGLGLLEAAVAARQNDVPAAHHHAGRRAVIVAGSAPVHPRAVVHVLGLDHGYGGLGGLGQGLERPLAVIVAQAVAGSHVVEQVGAIQGCGAIEQSYPDDGVLFHRSGGAPHHRAMDQQRQRQGGTDNLHNSFSGGTYHLWRFPPCVR